MGPIRLGKKKRFEEVVAKVVLIWHGMALLGCEACVNLWYSGPDALERPAQDAEQREGSVRPW